MTGWPLVLGCFSAAAAVATGPPWAIEIVDASGPARSTTMRADRQGNLHLAYVVADAAAGYPMKYAFWDRALARWFVMEAAQNVANCSLALDSLDRPHISFADAGSAGGSNLRYLRWHGTEWEKETLPLSSDVSAFNSIALDSQDRPTITFYEHRGPRDTGIGGRLRNVKKADGQWQVRTVDPQEGSGKFNCTASQGDRTFIAYANVSAGASGLRFAAWQDNVWRSEVVDAGERDTVGDSVCLTVDSAGAPHAVYSNATRPAIRYAVRKNGAWTVVSVMALAGSAQSDRHGIAAGPDNRPYLTYFDAGRGELFMAYPNASESKAWTVEAVDGGGAGFNSSVQLDRDTIYIAYSDGSRGAMKVARRKLMPIVSGLAGGEAPGREAQR